MVRHRPRQPTLLHKKSAIALIDVVRASEVQKLGRAVDLPALSLELHKKAYRRFVEHQLYTSPPGQRECRPILLIAEPAPQAQRLKDLRHLLVVGDTQFVFFANLVLSRLARLRPVWRPFKGKPGRNFRPLGTHLARFPWPVRAASPALHAPTQHPAA